MNTKEKRRVEDELRATGMPWRIVPGGKHAKVFLNGKLVGVLSNTNSPELGPGPILTRIRRVARGLDL